MVFQPGHRAPVAPVTFISTSSITHEVGLEGALELQDGRRVDQDSSALGLGYVNGMDSLTQSYLPSDLCKLSTGSTLDKITTDVIWGVTHGQAVGPGKNPKASRFERAFSRPPQNTAPQASAVDPTADDLEWLYHPSMNTLLEGRGAQTARWLEASQLQPSASATSQCSGKLQDTAVLPLDSSNTRARERDGRLDVWRTVDGVKYQGYDARSLCSHHSHTDSSHKLNWGEPATRLPDGRLLAHECFSTPVPKEVANYFDVLPSNDGSGLCYLRYRGPKWAEGGAPDGATVRKTRRTPSRFTNQQIESEDELDEDGHDDMFWLRLDGKEIRTRKRMKQTQPLGKTSDWDLVVAANPELA